MKNSNVLLNENNIHNAYSNTTKKAAAFDAGAAQSILRNQLCCSDVREEMTKKQINKKSKNKIKQHLCTPEKPLR